MGPPSVAAGTSLSANFLRTRSHNGARLVNGVGAPQHSTEDCKQASRESSRIERINAFAAARNNVSNLLYNILALFAREARIDR